MHVLVAYDSHQVLMNIGYLFSYRAHIFWQKMLEYNILYDIEKNIENAYANHSATLKAMLTKMLVQPERLYFRFAFCARNYPW